MSTSSSGPRSSLASSAPNGVSSPSPTGRSRLVTTLTAARASASSSRLISAASAISSSVGSRPSLAASSRLTPRDPALALPEVNRDPDRPGAVVQRALDRLADPERGVGGELVALAPVELLGGADQPEDALLDQVEQRQVVALVFAGVGDHQPQVRVHQRAPWPRGRRARSAWPARPPRRGSAADSGEPPGGTATSRRSSARARSSFT